LDRNWGQIILARTIALALYLSTLTAFAPAVGLADEHRPRVTYGDALQWYFDAAQAGNAQAQFLLGLKYETGTDVTRDFAAAANWYEKAARQGYLEAQFKLATFLARGRGRDADPVAAAQWYERAARAGFAPAQYNLGVLQLNAASNEVERIDGLVWLIRARDQGVEPAANFVARIEALWPAEIVAAAERRAADAEPANTERAQ
jgi:TPR repeat protein